MLLHYYLGTNPQGRDAVEGIRLVCQRHFRQPGATGRNE